MDLDKRGELFNEWRYWVKLLLLIVIVIPIVSQFFHLISLAGLAGLKYGFNINEDWYFTEILTDHRLFFFSMFILLVSLTAIGYFYGRKTYLANNRRSFYLTFFGIILYVFTVWLILVSVTNANTLNRTFNDIRLLAFLPYVFIYIYSLLASISLIVPLFIIITYLVFIVSFSMGVKASGQRLSLSTRQCVSASLIVAGLFVITLYQWQKHYTQLGLIDISFETEVREDIVPQIFRPFKSTSRLTPLRGKPELVLQSDMPKISGATFLLPVYASMINAIYQPQDEQSQNVIKNTPSQWYSLDRLGRDELDIVISGRVSESIIRKVEEDNGIRLAFIPIAKEALVFTVNEHNPLKDISTSQIKSIYNGTIDNWSQLGFGEGKILAFQRWGLMSSQGLMKALIMGDSAMIEPIKGERHRRGIKIRPEIADYQNRKDAIGYSFRYFALTANKTSRDIRLLSINGIEPTEDNIRSGAYPFTTDIYMIVNSDKMSENTKKIEQWLLSTQGQRMIQDVGYVPIIRLAD